MIRRARCGKKFTKPFPIADSEFSQINRFHRYLSSLGQLGTISSAPSMVPILLELDTPTAQCSSNFPSDPARPCKTRVGLGTIERSSAHHSSACFRRNNNKTDGPPVIAS